MYLSSKICPTCGNAKPPDPLVDKLPKAFRDGFIAAGDGKSTTDNPYERHTVEYDSWCRGYEERKSI